MHDKVPKENLCIFKDVLECSIRMFDCLKIISRLSFGVIHLVRTQNFSKN